MSRLKIISVIFLPIIFYSSGAFAQLTSQGILDQVITEFATRASGWQTVVTNAATRLFWILGAISLTWTGTMLMLRKADIGEFFAEFIRFILFFGFYLWLLRNGPLFADSIIKSFLQLSQQASGIQSSSPSDMVNIGFMIIKQAIFNISILSPIYSAAGLTLSVGILIALAAVAANMLVILVSGWILIYAGIIYLGFGGSRWTSDMAITYYKTVLGIAVQLFAMTLLVGIGNDLLTTFYSKMNQGTINLEELCVMFVFCFVLLLLINKIPPLLSGVITGASFAHAGIGNYGAGDVINAAMTAAQLTVASLSGVASGASALKAAIARGMEHSAANEGTPLVFGDRGSSSQSGDIGGGTSWVPSGMDVQPTPLCCEYSADGAAIGIKGCTSESGAGSTSSSRGASGGPTSPSSGGGSSATTSSSPGRASGGKTSPSPAGNSGSGASASPGGGSSGNASPSPRGDSVGGSSPFFSQGSSSKASPSPIGGSGSSTSPFFSQTPEGKGSSSDGAIGSVGKAPKPRRPPIQIDQKEHSVLLKAVNARMNHTYGEEIAAEVKAYGLEQSVEEVIELVKMLPPLPHWDTPHFDFDPDKGKSS
jgi:type IV secretion system protein TrbL